MCVSLSLSLSLFLISSRAPARNFLLVCMQDRLYAVAAQHREHVAQLAQQLETERLAECTFKPRLNKKTPRYLDGLERRPLYTLNSASHRADIASSAEGIDSSGGEDRFGSIDARCRDVASSVGEEETSLLADSPSPSDDEARPMAVSDAASARAMPSPRSCAPSPSSKTTPSASPTSSLGVNDDDTSPRPIGTAAVVTDVRAHKSNRTSPAEEAIAAAEPCGASSTLPSPTVDLATDVSARTARPASVLSQTPKRGGLVASSSHHHRRTRSVVSTTSLHSSSSSTAPTNTGMPPGKVGDGRQDTATASATSSHHHRRTRSTASASSLSMLSSSSPPLSDIRATMTASPPAGKAAMTAGAATTTLGTPGRPMSGRRGRADSSFTAPSSSSSLSSSAALAAVGGGAAPPPPRRAVAEARFLTDLSFDQCELPDMTDLALSSS